MGDLLSLHRPKLLAMFLVSAFLPHLAFSAANTWINPGDGSWEIGTNWSLGTPSNTDSIFITNNGSYTVSIDDTTANTGDTSTWMQVSTIAVSAPSGLPTLLIDFTNAARVLNLSSVGTGALTIGNATGRNGQVVLANGQLNVNAIASGAIVNSIIGNTGQGTFIISNGNFNSPFVDVGAAAGGIGQWDIYGGTSSNSLALVVARVAASTGTVRVAGGLLNVSGTSTFVGFEGLGIVQVDSGTFNVNALTLGYNATGRGQLNMNGGVANVAAATIGRAGTGTMTVSNGTFNTPANGSASVIVGDLAGGNGQMFLYGGTNNFLKIASGALNIGNSSGSTGSVLLAGGVLNVNGVTNGSAVNTQIGNSGRGTFTVSNGTFNSPFVDVASSAGGVGDWNIYGGTNNVNLALLVARNISNTGSIHVAGGLLNVTAGTTFFGYQGRATMTVSGGVVNVRTISVGDQPTGNGQIEIAGGTFNATNAGTSVFIGNLGRGTLTVGGGSFNAASVEVSGSASSGAGIGTWNVNGGTNNASSLVIARNPGGTGTVNVTGGILNSPGTTYVGLGGRGDVRVSGGVLNIPNVNVGNNASGSGQIVIDGGAVTATNTGTSIVVLGVHGKGTLIISNGSFIASNVDNGSTTVGGSTGTGDWRMYGGTGTVSSFTVVGRNLNATGSVLVAGGLLSNPGTMIVGLQGRGSVTVSNGTLNVGTLAVGDYAANTGGNGSFDVYGGLGSVNFGLTVGSQNATTGSVQIANTGILEMKSSLTVGGTGTGKGSLTNRDGGTMRFTAQNNPTVTRNTGGTLISTNAIVEFKDASAANLVGNVTNIVLQGDNTLSLYNATNAILGSYTFQSNTAQTFASLRMINGGTRWQSTNLTVAAGSSLLASNTIGSVRGIVTNLGTISVVNSRMTFENTVLISGRYASDPSTNTFLSDVTVSESGTLAGGAGDLFDFQKSLLIHSTNRFGFDLDKSAVKFSGGGMHTNAITGQDFGTNDLGYADNFAYGELHLGLATDQVCFACGNIPTAASNGLYVGWLDLLNDTNLVANLHATNTIHIYYDVTDTRNAYLGGLSYSLTDCDLVSTGGMLMPVIPEPSALVFITVACTALLRKRRS